MASIRHFDLRTGTHGRSRNRTKYEIKKVDYIGYGTDMLRFTQKAANKRKRGRLTPEARKRRSEIARKAVNARWEREHVASGHEE